MTIFPDESEPPAMVTPEGVHDWHADCKVCPRDPPQAQPLFTPQVYIKLAFALMAALAVGVLIARSWDG